MVRLTESWAAGFLRNDYLTVTGALIEASEPRVVANIAATSDDQARKVIA